MTIIDKALTPAEQTRRREFMRDNMAASKAGVTYEKFLADRDERAERWMGVIRDEMAKAHYHDDDIEGVAAVLPTVLAKMEEAAIVAARAVAKREAEATVKTMLRRAMA
jgi:hypothetical protein